MDKIKRVTVFAASSEQIDNIYKTAAYELGVFLAKNNIEVIYGGGKIGLMGKLSDGALSAGGKVSGIIPKFMMDLEWGRQDIHQLIEVSTMHVREDYLITNCDAIIALPGGIGTLEELLQAMSWKYLGLIIKPIIIYNINNYFDNLLNLLNQTISEGFMADSFISCFKVAENIDDIEKQITEIYKI